MAVCHPVMLWVMSVSVVEARLSLPTPQERRRGDRWGASAHGTARALPA